jgi:hypothetical protein
MKKILVWDRIGHDRDVFRLCEEAVKERYADPHAPDASVRIPQAVIRRRLRRRDPPPPLAAMTAVGRGAGDVLTRLYLWLFVLATGQLQESRCSKGPSEWARLLNLVSKKEWRDPLLRRRAGRRVTNAVKWLSDRKLITNPKRRVVGLLDPRTLEPYHAESPRELEKRLKSRAARQIMYGQRSLERSNWWEGPPLDLPVLWWSNGTISALKGVELACLLVMWERSREESGPFRVPRIVARNYGIRKGRWQRGCVGLEQLGFLTRKKVGTLGSAIEYEYMVDWSAVSAKREARAPERVKGS